MHITFAGHQGWIFEDDHNYILLDVIYEKIGNASTQLPIYPCRKLKKNFFSKKNVSIIISHEHSDHFSIETLLWHDKGIDVYVPFHSASSLKETITALGFNLKIMNTFENFLIGQIQFTPLPSRDSALEPDVYCLLVEDIYFQKTFFTTIDAYPHDNTFDWLDECCPQRTIDNFTNNHIERPTRAAVSSETDLTLSFNQVAECVQNLYSRFHSKTIILSGQGWCFENEKSYFNNVFFSVKTSELVNFLQSQNSDKRFYSAELGDSFVLENSFTKTCNESFYENLPTPNRDFTYTVANDFGFKPWSGILEISEHDMMDLSDYILNKFGKILGCQARKINHALFELQTYPGTEEPYFSLLIKNGSSLSEYLYDFRDSQFIRKKSQEKNFYPMGLEIWASDLRTIINCEEEAYLIYESSVREWNIYPTLMDEIFSVELFAYFTPRFTSDQYKLAYKNKIHSLQRNRIYE